MIICLVCVIISLILSFGFKDIYPVDKKKRKTKQRSIFLIFSQNPISWAIKEEDKDQIREKREVVGINKGNDDKNICDD